MVVLRFGQVELGAYRPVLGGLVGAQALAHSVDGFRLGCLVVQALPAATCGVGDGVGWGFPLSPLLSLAAPFEGSSGSLSSAFSVFLLVSLSLYNFVRL